MLSIPRDLYVEYDDNKWSEWKINGIYAKNYYKSESKQKWMEALKSKVSKITWEKIDYFVNVDFNWFTKVIDALGWIEINVPNNFVDDQYPDGNWGYRTLVFRKWTWNFTWDNALKYARSRHSTSDFDRSLRQQQVISWAKQKIIEADYLTSPKKIKEFYNIYKQYIYSDIWITDLLTFLPIFKDVEKMKILPYNINDSCFYWSNTCEKWGFLYTPERVLYNGMSVLLLNWTEKNNLNEYDDFQLYTNRIYNNQEFFIENHEINVFNSLKVNHLAWILSNDIVPYGFNIPKYNSIWNTPIVYPNSIIYYNNIDEDSETIKYLKEFFKWEFIKTQVPKYSKVSSTKVEIIIWEDYLDTEVKTFIF
jgi:LCP family protein required for cell wall assembly